MKRFRPMEHRTVGLDQGNCAATILAPGNLRLVAAYKKFAFFAQAHKHPSALLTPFQEKFAKTVWTHFFSPIHFLSTSQTAAWFVSWFHKSARRCSCPFSEHLNHIHMVCHPCAKAMLVSSLHLHNFSVFWPHVFRMELWFRLANHTPQQVNAVKWKTFKKHMPRV